MYRIKKIMQKFLRLVCRYISLRSIKSICKKHWNKALSVICAAVMVAMSVVVAYAESSVSGGGSGLIRGSQPISILEATNYMCVVLKTDIFVVWGSYNIENYGSDYGVKFISKKGSNSEWGNHIWYVWKNDEGEITSELQPNLGDDYTIIGNNRFAGESSPATISAADLKKAAADYNSRYAPMPTQTMWKWSYQTELSYKPAKSATPYIPIYWSNYGAWGGKDGNWKECYVLPFLTDDDVSAPYYCNYYYHFYPTFDDDHTPYINIELYSLIDNQLYTADSWKFSFKSGTFDGKTAVLALNLLGYRAAPHLYGYTSDVGYLTSTTDSGMFTYNQISRNSSGYSFSGGALSNLTLNKYLNNLISESTFTPDASTGDDWGAYISQTPFQLWGNQTTVDWDRVPDNYYITIQGDNFYDYSIHNPDTGDECPFGDFLIDYDIPDLVDPDEDDGDNSGGSGGKVSGDVNVGGKIDVSGDIVIKADPIDINVNVNTSGGSSGAGTSEGVIFDEDISLNNYYGWMQEQTTGFGAFMQAFFGWLPEPIVIMLCAGFALVILARFLGR